MKEIIFFSFSFLSGRRVKRFKPATYWSKVYLNHLSYAYVDKEIYNTKRDNIYLFQYGFLIRRNVRLVGTTTCERLEELGDT